MNLQQYNESSISYLQVKAKDNINTYPLIRKICNAISLTIAYILTLLQNHIVKIKDHSANKDNLNLGEYLNFQRQVCGKNLLMSEKFNNKTYVQGFKFQLLTCKYIKELRQNLDSKQLIPITVKLRMYCKEKEKQKVLFLRT